MRHSRDYFIDKCPWKSYSGCSVDPVSWGLNIKDKVEMEMSITFADCLGQNFQYANQNIL